MASHQLKKHMVGNVDNRTWPLCWIKTKTFWNSRYLIVENPEQVNCKMCRKFLPEEKVQ